MRGAQKKQESNPNDIERRRAPLVHRLDDFAQSRNGTGAYGRLGGLQYDSLSTMLCALYLEGRTDVVRFSFEPRRYRFEANGDLAPLDCIPDFEAVLATGEVLVVEAKYSPDQMREKERSKLALTAVHFECAAIPYEAVYRLEL